MYKSSSDARKTLKATCLEVAETGEPCVIQMDGKSMVQLTTVAPTSGTPPLRIKMADARGAWPELLTYVAITGAKFFFKFRDDEDSPVYTVYVVKSQEYENPFRDVWKEHRQEYRAAQDKSGQFEERLDQFQEDLEAELDDVLGGMRDMLEEYQQRFSQMEKRVMLAYATLTRPNGNPLATPESGLVPLKTADNSFEPPETE